MQESDMWSKQKVRGMGSKHRNIICAKAILAEMLAEALAELLGDIGSNLADDVDEIASDIAKMVEEVCE